MIGTFNSGCAEIIVPVLNRASNGPIAMVSPANTYVGLTHPGPGTVAGEPGKYYPTGKRNYARVVAADDYQGAADALLAKSLGVKKVFILNDKEAYGLGVATNFKNAASEARHQGRRLHGVGRQGVVLRGTRGQDQGVGRAGRVPRRPDLRERRQADQGHLQAGAPERQDHGCLTASPRSRPPSSRRGTAANGMTVSVAGLPNTALKGAGKAFVEAFTKADQRAPDPYSVYAAQAAEVLVAGDRTVERHALRTSRSSSSRST